MKRRKHLWRTGGIVVGLLTAGSLVAVNWCEAQAPNPATPGEVAAVAEVIAAVQTSAIEGEKTDWPHYRGPNFNGTTADAGWSADWKGKPKVAWEKDLGTSAAGVVVADGVVYTMGNKNNRDIVYAYDEATGNEKWTFDYACDLGKRQFEGGPGATPTYHDGIVYTLSHEGLFHAIDAKTGKKLWSTHLVDDYQGNRQRWGYSQSPLVLGDAVIIEPGNKGGSSTVALDRKTGKELWKSGNDEAGYAAPVPMTVGDKTYILTFKGDALVAIDPSDRGKEVWRHRWPTRYSVNASSPIVIGDLVFIASGYGQGCALLKFGQAEPVWQNKSLAPQVCQPAIHDGYIYGFDGQVGKGNLVCVDLKTGDQKWSQRGMGAGTLVIADGKLIVLSEKGELSIVEASPDRYRRISGAQVVRGRCWVTPAFANDRVYVRSNDGELVVLDLSK